MMQYTKPIYITRKDIFLPSDEIIPYDDRTDAASESANEAAILHLFSIFQINKEK